MNHRRTLILTALFLLAATLASAAVPEIERFMPRGGRRGTEVEVTFSGQRLGDARGLLFYEPGIARQIAGRAARQAGQDPPRPGRRLPAGAACPAAAIRDRHQQPGHLQRRRPGGSQRSQTHQRLCQAAEDRAQFHRQRPGPERGRQLLRRRGQEGPAAERRGGGPAVGRVVLRSGRGDHGREPLRAGLGRRHAAPAPGLCLLARRPPRRDLRGPGPRKRLRRLRPLPLSPARRHLPSPSGHLSGGRPLRRDRRCDLCRRGGRPHHAEARPALQTAARLCRLAAGQPGHGPLAQPVPPLALGERARKGAQQRRPACHAFHRPGGARTV